MRNLRMVLPALAGARGNLRLEVAALQLERCRSGDDGRRDMRQAQAPPMTAPDTLERETRMIECPGCDGEGGYETLTHYDARNGEPCGYWTTCGVCNGAREIEVEVEPITLEDLDG